MNKANQKVKHYLDSVEMTFHNFVVLAVSQNEKIKVKASFIFPKLKKE